MKTKNKKPAVKKKAALPKKKLIEGKYSHKFLTRLFPQVGETLEQLKKDLHEKTANGCIVKVITDYKIVNDRLKDLITENEKLKSNNGEMVETVSDYIELHKKLFSLKIDKIDSREESCDSCYDDFPAFKLTTYKSMRLCAECLKDEKG